MKLLIRFLLLLCLSNPFHGFGQDTVSVYFEFSRSKISVEQQELLNAIPTSYDLSDLDSIQFIGMTDSVGKLKSNLKLAEKRAGNVAKYCARLFPPNTLQSVHALGEASNPDDQKNRRVDVLLFFPKQSSNDTINPQVQIIETENGCYNVDYDLLHASHIRTIKKRSKSKVIIETSLKNVKNKNEHYYAISNSKGEFITKKVKWKAKKTGKLWWAKNRYVATVPEVSFKSFKIFKLGGSPCDTCSEDFPRQQKIEKDDTCRQVDYFLMDNIQFKRKFLSKKWGKVRVPREYVNIEERYFTSRNAHETLEWTTKRGKRKKLYYFAKVPRHLDYLYNITKAMDCCKFDTSASGYTRPLMTCGTVGEYTPSIVLHGEIGTHFQQAKLLPYAGIGIYLEDKTNRLHAIAGTDFHVGFHAALRYQFSIVNFSYKDVNPFAAWKFPGTPAPLETLGQLYVGMEFKTSRNTSDLNYFEQNVHIGIAALNLKRKALVPRIFLQYGLGYDYLQNNATKIYSIGQLGVNLKLARLR